MMCFSLDSISSVSRMMLGLYTGTQGGILSKRDERSNYRAIGRRKTYINITSTIASLNQGVGGSGGNIPYDYKALSLP